MIFQYHYLMIFLPCYSISLDVSASLPGKVPVYKLSLYREKKEASINNRKYTRGLTGFGNICPDYLLNFAPMMKLKPYLMSSSIFFPLLLLLHLPSSSPPTPTLLDICPPAPVSSHLFSYVGPWEPPTSSCVFPNRSLLSVNSLVCSHLLQSFPSISSVEMMKGIPVLCLQCACQRFLLD